MAAQVGVRGRVTAHFGAGLAALVGAGQARGELWQCVLAFCFFSYRTLAARASRRLFSSLLSKLMCVCMPGRHGWCGMRHVLGIVL